jgi:excisionase family DNA binding protein
MKGQATNEANVTPMLFPYDPEQYWQKIREIIRQELQQLPRKTIDPPEYHTPGMTYKPLYKIGEVCQIFQVTRPTIYDWVKHGKLKPYKIRSRVFFLWKDIEQLIDPTKQSSPNNQNPSK